MKKLLFLIAFLFLFPTWAWAACTGGSPTWTSSPDYISVSSCISQSSEGDTINVSSGSATWSSDLNITGKAITLKGAGVVDSNGDYSVSGTFITLSGAHLTIRSNPSAVSSARITGFQFNYNADEGLNGAIQMYGLAGALRNGAKNWRIDNNYFNFTGSNANTAHAIVIRGWTFGLIDTCHFHYQGRAILVDMGNDDWSQEASPYYSPWQSGGAVYGDGSWNTTWGGGALDWGASLQSGHGYPYQVVIEGNWFYADPEIGASQIIDGRGGARATLRYNKFQDVSIMGHNGCSNSERSWLQFEVYSNVWKFYLSKGNFTAFIRGGTFVFYDNIVDTSGGGTTGGFKVDDWRGTGFNCNPGGPTYWSNPASCSWPCLDQIGTGPSTVGPILDANAAVSSQPAYYWNNRDQNNNLLSFWIGDGASIVQSGRDIINNGTTPKPGYTAYQYPHALVGGIPQEDVTPPVITSNTLHGTELSCTSDPRDVTVPIGTNENATCRISTTDQTFAEMGAGKNMTGVGTQSHTSTLTELACSASYTRYVRCQDTAPALNTMTTSSVTTFTIAAGETSQAPIMSGQLPTTGSQLSCTSNPRDVGLQLITNKNATCKYSTTDQAYATMENTYAGTGTQSHTATESLACGQTHTFYSRCTDGVNTNTSSAVTTFGIVSDIPSPWTEAESGTLAGAMSAVADANASGGYYIQTSAEMQGTATFTVNVPVAGTYRIVARFYAADSGSDSYFLQINSLPQIIWPMNYYPAVPEKYNVWLVAAIRSVEQDPYQVTLEEGNHTFVFSGREVGARLDYFYLVSMDVTPIPPEPTGLLIIGAGATMTIGVGGTLLIQ